MCCGDLSPQGSKSHQVFSRRLEPDRPHSWCHRCSCRGRTECSGSERLTDDWTSAPLLRTCHRTAAPWSATLQSEEQAASHTTVWKRNTCCKMIRIWKTRTAQHYLVWFWGSRLTVVLEPVQLPQHGPGRGPVFVRQVEEVWQKLQVVQCQRFSCVQRVLIGPGNIGALSYVCLHGLLIWRLFLETSWRTTRDKGHTLNSLNRLLLNERCYFMSLPPGRAVLRNSWSQSVRARVRAFWGL